MDEQQFECYCQLSDLLQKLRSQYSEDSANYALVTLSKEIENVGMLQTDNIDGGQELDGVDAGQCLDVQDVDETTQFYHIASSNTTPSSLSRKIAPQIKHAYVDDQQGYQSYGNNIHQTRGDFTSQSFYQPTKKQ